MTDTSATPASLIPDSPRSATAHPPGHLLNALIQNARVAGATSIQLTFAGDTLSVADNGKGISDLTHLLHAASISQGSEVREGNHPLAPGIATALAACDAIRVASRATGTDARGFVAVSEHVLAGESVAIVPVYRPEQGTTVTLYGVMMDA